MIYNVPSFRIFTAIKTMTSHLNCIRDRSIINYHLDPVPNLIGSRVPERCHISVSVRPYISPGVKGRQIRSFQCLKDSVLYISTQLWVRLSSKTG